MATPPRERVSVNDDGDYNNVSHNPREDANAYSRDDGAIAPHRPGHIDAGRDRRGAPEGVALPLLRSAVRSHEEVARDRHAREIPSWAPYAFSALVVVALTFLCVAAVLQTIQPEEPPAPPEPPKLDDFGGVPVRDDLNAPGL